MTQESQASQEAEFRQEEQQLTQTTLRKKILVIGAEVGEYITQMLSANGYESKLFFSYGEPLPRAEIFAELAQGEYEIVIVAYWKCCMVLLDIRKQFPAIKTIFICSYEKYDTIGLKWGVDAVFSAPFGEDLPLLLLSKVDEIFTK